jgi:S-adenosylmethionine hydrolase
VNSIANAILTLTTDFGVGSTYVAQLKAVLLRQLPTARLIDLSHSIAPQAIDETAWFVEQSCPWFPTDTLHLVVVDPGVGTARRIVLLRTAGQWFLGPDNGIFGPLVRSHGGDAAWELTESSLWARDPSPTFHGRDIMAPVACQVLGGLPPDRVGLRIDPRTLQPGATWDYTRGERFVHGRVIFLDSFGNAVTSIPAAALPSPLVGLVVRATPGRRESGDGATDVRFQWVTTYGERPPGSRVALVGSGGQVEIAVVQGSAARDENLRVGDRVAIDW